MDTSRVHLDEADLIGEADIDLAEPEMPRKPGPLAGDESPFGTFLRSCRGRGDRVSALADVALRDPTWPGGGDIVALRAYFRQMGARAFVLDTLDEAWREHLKTHKLFSATQKRRAKNKVAKAARKRNRRSR